MNVKIYSTEVPYTGTRKLTTYRAGYKHSLTFCVRRYAVISAKPVHRLQTSQ